MENWKQKIYLLLALAGIGFIAGTVFAADAGVRWFQTDPVAGAIWTARNGHSALVFNNKMWILGGTLSPGYKNDVWLSFNGINWVQRTPSAAWQARTEHASLVFNNKMWVLGGSISTGFKNDVWSSADGFTWNSETAAAAWPARDRHASLVFNNKMWILGGSTSAGSKNDVWSSVDGITWTQETASAGWSPRFDLVALVFNNKMWVLGGSGSLNDAWSSSDGVTWTRVSPAIGADWPGRSGHTGVVYDGKMWIFGGQRANTIFNDAWYSVDGISWSQALLAADSQWGARWNHASLVFNNKMWILGGSGGPNKNDIWHSQQDNLPVEACVITSDRNRTVDAEFKGQLYTVTVVSINQDGAGKGAVSSTDNKISDCQTICSAENYAYNSSVALNAMAADGSEFDHWEGPSPCDNSAELSCSLTLTGDVTVYAVFKSLMAACVVEKSVTANFATSFPTCTLTIAPQGTNASQAIISWTTTNNPTSAVIDDGVGAPVAVTIPPASGSMTITPPGNTTYIMTVTNNAGSRTCSAQASAAPGRFQFKDIREILPF
ncbi:MAG: hypothetical protein Q8P76_04095 [bacterium]|nr:hypothetical protein [bacterium]